MLKHIFLKKNTQKYLAVCFSNTQQAVDYADFFIVSKADAQEQYDNAVKFFERVKKIF